VTGRCRCTATNNCPPRFGKGSAAFIARQNIARFVQTSRIDVDYLTTLSADAVPTLQSLPEPYRSCALTAINNELAEDRPDAWPEWNLGRSTARAELHDHPTAWVSCPP